MQDLTWLDWSESTVSSATGGSLLKARSGEGADATYYKLSCYDEVNGVYGHECVNELIASRLMDVLCIEHVPYRLVHAEVVIGDALHETWLCASDSFRAHGESKTSLAKFYGFNHMRGEGRIDFCERFGWSGHMRAMVLVDYLIANRDRHGGNLEVLKSRSGKLRLAPLFDNGLSLCFSTYSGEALRAIDPLQDVVANNFLGSRSVERNLTQLVPPDLPVGRLSEAHKGELMHGLDLALEHAIEDVSGHDFADFLWNMIWARWCNYESLRDSGRLAAQG